MESCTAGTAYRRLSMWVLGLRSQHVRRKPLRPPCELWRPKSASAWPAESTYQPLRFISWTHRSQHSAKHSVFKHVCLLCLFSVSLRTSHLCHFELPKSGTLLPYKAWNDTTGVGRNVTCLGNLLGFLGLLPCDPMRQTLKWLWRKDPEEHVSWHHLAVNSDSQGRFCSSQLA